MTGREEVAVMVLDGMCVAVMVWEGISVIGRVWWCGKEYL